MSAERLSILWEQYLSERMTSAEREEFQALGSDPANLDTLKGLVESSLRENDYYQESLHDKTATFDKIMQAAHYRVSSGQRSVHRVHFIRKWGWAAAAIFIVGASIVVAVSTKRGSGEVALSSNNTRKTDIAPGANRAMLTIGDAQPISLSSHKTGITVGNAITYNDGERIADAMQMLTLATPRGGQYVAVLPDGSKVWLNAASSIRFPSKFSEEKREVEVSGEVYMEVAQNLKSPFSVVAENTTIQVLGTSFNISAYSNEENHRTTLISGSVKVFPSGRGGRFDQKTGAVILKPGQQAITGSHDGESVKVSFTDIEQTLAWKNGLFYFEGVHLKELMRQIERWYDVSISYEPGVADIEFGGKMSRNVKLSDVLAGMEGAGIHFRMEGRKLIVMP